MSHVDGARATLAKGNARACGGDSWREWAKLLNYWGLTESYSDQTIIPVIGTTGRNLSELRKAVQNEAGGGRAARP